MGVMKVPSQKVGSRKVRKAAREVTMTTRPEREPTRIVTLIIGSLRNRKEEKRRRQTFCDKRDNNFVEGTFCQISPFFKQIFL